MKTILRNPLENYENLLMGPKIFNIILGDPSLGSKFPLRRRVM
jgi:hypothetical protein